MTAQDADAVSALLSTNARAALTPQERARSGFVQGDLGREALVRVARGTGGVVAVDDAGGVVGCALMHPPEAGHAGPPALAEEVAHEAGIVGAPHYGPVVVEAAWRRRGVVRALQAAALAGLAARGYARVTAFLEEENTVSAAVHDRLGWRPVGEFVWDGRTYRVLGRDTAP